MQGWSYVGDRLLSAVIPYEESGWYDGQMWVKPPEILACDRLLGSYKVKPVIKLLKQTLVGTGVLLVTAVFIDHFHHTSRRFYPKNFCKSRKHCNNKDKTTANMSKEELPSLP
ncbi:hypothetical protein HanIR_Chr15g0736821 [Helianthus annuus]|nr:hypothetical protein HanIR_Chr15g0736821 [Helianthus annuus]